MKPTLRPYLYLLGVVFIASLVLWLDRPAQDTSSGRPLLSTFNAADVATIEIEHLLNGVRLQRAETGWRVETLPTALAEKVPTAHQPEPAQPAVLPFPAEASRVDQLLKSLATLVVGAPVSIKAERHDQLQVGKLALQLRVKNGAGDTLAAVYIGKSGPDYFSTYVRKAGEEAVYLVADQLQGRFSATLEAWQDKTLWTLDPDQFASVAVDRLDGGLRLEKDQQGRFILTSPPTDTPLDLAKVTDWFKRWTELRAVEFPAASDAKRTGLAKPQYTLTVILKDGTTKVLKVGNTAASGNPYGVIEGVDQLALLPADLLGTLKVDWEEWTTAYK